MFDLTKYPCQRIKYNILDSPLGIKLLQTQVYLLLKRPVPKSLIQTLDGELQEQRTQTIRSVFSRENKTTNKNCYVKAKHKCKTSEA